MTALVTLKQACDYCRIDASEVDDIELMIDAASNAVLNYVGSSSESWFDSNGDVVEIPAAAKQSTLFLIAWFNRNRDQDAEGSFQAGYLPAPVTAMLYPLRDPALA